MARSRDGELAAQVDAHHVPRHAEVAASKGISSHLPELGRLRVAFSACHGVLLPHYSVRVRASEFAGISVRRSERNSDRLKHPPSYSIAPFSARQSSTRKRNANWRDFSV
jgi:hypothetical protein